MRLLRYSPLLVLLAMGCGETHKSNNDIGDSLGGESAKEETVDDGDGKHSDNKFEIRPENFVKDINNPYFSVVPGRKFYYDGQTPEGIKVHREILTSDRTKEIGGITTHGVWKREWHDDSLVSDTKGWYAQDKEGSVWVFAEDDLDIFGGFMKGTGQTWAFGVGKTRAGIVLPGNAKAGQTFNREINGYFDLKGEVAGINESVTVPNGMFKDCIKIRDLDVTSKKEEFNYYCKETGNLALVTFANSIAKLELTKTENNFPSSGMDIKYQEYKVNINEEKAKEIALKEVEGGLSVGTAVIQLWKNKPAYAVEVFKEENKKVMVYINVQNGSVVDTVD